ncbi:hypothetical protein TYRP_008669 [Tyrophagus putrescentiae]|nr:hypothetical protein TYRP_008669 [Tyrophagus putrescentiae]
MGKTFDGIVKLLGALDRLLRHLGGVERLLGVGVTLCDGRLIVGALRVTGTGASHAFASFYFEMTVIDDGAILGGGLHGLLLITVLRLFSGRIGARRTERADGRD